MLCQMQIMVLTLFLHCAVFCLFACHHSLVFRTKPGAKRVKSGGVLSNGRYNLGDAALDTNYSQTGSPAAQEKKPHKPGMDPSKNCKRLVALCNKCIV